MHFSASSSSSNSETVATGSAPLFPVEHILPFALVTALFFLWGMSNNLTDILVQQFKKSFELSPLQAQLVQTAVFFGYFSMAIPSALMMRRYGYKSGILAGLCMFGSGHHASCAGLYRATDRQLCHGTPRSIIGIRGGCALCLLRFSVRWKRSRLTEVRFLFAGDRQMALRNAWLIIGRHAMP